MTPLNKKLEDVLDSKETALDKKDELLKEYPGSPYYEAHCTILNDQLSWSIYFALEEGLSK